MLIQRKRHKIPGLNTTATADISFMLLIFFLVTTSMDVDKGLRRQLPPAQKEEVQEESLVDKHKLLNLSILPNNTLLVDGRLVASGQLRHTVETFVRRVGKEHLISLNVSPEAEYRIYFQVQNELVAAYKAVRNRMALQRYGQPFDRCSQARRDAIVDSCPQRIAETYQQKPEETEP